MHTVHAVKQAYVLAEVDQLSNDLSDILHGEHSGPDTADCPCVLHNIPTTATVIDVRILIHCIAIYIWWCSYQLGVGCRCRGRISVPWSRVEPSNSNLITATAASTAATATAVYLSTEGVDKVQWTTLIKLELRGVLYIPLCLGMSLVQVNPSGIS